MPLGGIFTAFFLLLAIAALTSAVSVLIRRRLFDRRTRSRSSTVDNPVRGGYFRFRDSGVALRALERHDGGRKNHLRPDGLLREQPLLPIGGILISLFVGWSIKPRAVAEFMKGATIRLG